MSKQVGSWLNWQLILVIAYPLSLLQIVLFWIRFARFEYLRSMNVFIVALHFYVITFYCIVAMIITTATDGKDDNPARDGFLFLGIFFAVIALIFHWIYKAVNDRKLELLDTYYQLAMHPSYTNVNQIAVYTGRSPAAVVLALQFMNQYGLLPVLANEATGELFYDERYQEAAPPEEEWQDTQPHAEAQTVSDNGPLTVECAGCGSKAQIYRDRPAVCEYCATPLSWPAQVS
ncbi:hypothetical protein [Cohnella nanjingensis]|nr:hypothetical protein [Cohnella nanjingensis]